MRSAALIVVLLLGCATLGEPGRPASPQPPPSPGVLQELGYKDIVALGEQRAEQLGYTNPQLRSAEEFSRGLWRVRFGVGADHDLIVELDAFAKEVRKTVEVTATSTP